MFFQLQDTSEKLQVGTYVWRNKDDPDLYAEWDFEVTSLMLPPVLLLLESESFLIFMIFFNCVIGMETT